MSNAIIFEMMTTSTSDLYSRHTVGVAGDDVMYHILVAFIDDTLPLQLAPGAYRY